MAGPARALKAAKHLKT